MKLNKTACFLMLISVAAASVCAQSDAPGSAEWTGKGDGTNWWDAANWHPSIVPTNTAKIGKPDERRTVIVDQPVHVNTLVFVNSDKNHIRLDADLSVSNFMGGAHRASLDMNGHTLTLHESERSYLPRLTQGSGLLRKIGSGNCYAPGNSIGYSGDFEVRSGRLIFWGGNMGAGGSRKLTIHDGARIEVMNPQPEPVVFPSNVVVHGVGSGEGALTFVYKDFGFASDLTAASDAKVSVKVNVTWGGHIRGPGRLAFGAALGKTNRLTGVLVCSVTGTAANRISVDSGMLDIGNGALRVEGGGTAATEEYVLIDYSAEDGSVTGQFAATNSIPKRWFVEYAGTDAHPDCVVLINPPPADAAVTIP